MAQANAVGTWAGFVDSAAETTGTRSIRDDGLGLTVGATPTYWAAFSLIGDGVR